MSYRQSKITWTESIMVMTKERQSDSPGAGARVEKLLRFCNALLAWANALMRSTRDQALLQIPWDRESSMVTWMIGRLTRGDVGCYIITSNRWRTCLVTSSMIRTTVLPSSFRTVDRSAKPVIDPKSGWAVLYAGICCKWGKAMPQNSSAWMSELTSYSFGRSCQ